MIKHEPRPAWSLTADGCRPTAEQTDSDTGTDTGEHPWQPTPTGIAVTDRPTEGDSMSNVTDPTDDTNPQGDGRNDSVTELKDPQLPQTPPTNRDRQVDFSDRAASTIGSWVKQRRPELMYMLDGSGLTAPPDLYVGRTIVRAVFVGFIIAAAIITAAVVPPAVSTLRTGLIIGGSALGAGLLATTVAVALPLARRWFIAVERKRQIDIVLPEAISFMYTQSVGGVGHLDIIRLLAQSERSYDEVARSFQAIVREAEYFGSDYKTAIRNEADRTPSDELQSFLLDFLSVLNSGGDLTEFLERKADDAIEATDNEQQRTLDILELVTELYLAGSLFPVLFIVAFVIVSTFRTIPDAIFGAMTYVIIPVLSLVFIILVNMVTIDQVSTGLLADTDQSQSIQDSLTRLEDTNRYTADETAYVAAQGQRQMDASFGSTVAVSDRRTDEYVPKPKEHPAASGVFSTPIIDRHSTDHSIFSTAKRSDQLRNLKYAILNPGAFFRERPLNTAWVTVPILAFFYLITTVTGVAPPLSATGFTTNPVPTTLWYVYLPIIGLMTPYALAFEYQSRLESNVFTGFPDTLRNLASANDTGISLIESIREAGMSGRGRVDDEFTTVYRKTRLGMPLTQALLEFANKYTNPKISRTVRLLNEAQRTSEHVSEVVKTAIKTVDNRVALEKQRIDVARAQVAVIILTNGMVLVVMLLLDRLFLPLLSGEQGASALSGGTAPGGPTGGLGLSGVGNFATGLDPTIATMFFFHTVTVHAMASAILAGNVREGNPQTGFKYMIVMLIITAAAWSGSARVI